jgi:hypothetical protein
MAGIARALRPDQELTVALVGPHALVERIVLAGLPGAAGRGMHEMPGMTGDETRRRLLMAAYRNEQEAPEKVAKLGKSADACLFASRAPYEYARRAGVLNCPATYIQLGDGPLFAALRQAVQAGLDVTGASFDTVSRPEVERGLAMLGRPNDRAHLHEEVAGTAAIASFHTRLWRIGQTSAAFTCLDEVARRLAAAQVPVVTVQPSDVAISSALQISTLLASNRVLADCRLAVAMVEVPALRDGASRRAPRQAREELRLTVHRFLVQEAHRIHAAVAPVSEHGFIVHATSGSLTAGVLGDPPLEARARAAVGLNLEVAIGTGRTQREAEDRARLMLARAYAGTSAASSTASAGPGSPSHRAGPPAVDSDQAADLAKLQAGRILQADQRQADQRQPDQRQASRRQPGDSLSKLRGLETLARLAQKLAADATPVVDAELTGQLLSVTPRTARRQLRALVDEGLALPLPPSRSQHPGRPRQAYRLVVEKLDRRAAL